ncbi:MAG: NUDIX hydrolase [Janthinobacterium lividum]
MMPNEFPTPIVTVDAVLMTLSDGALAVGLIKREQPPLVGVHALPGGYVHVQEDDTLEAAAARILRDKAQVECRFLEQLGTFSGATRDPRGWSLTVAYFALVPAAELNAADSMLSLHPLTDLPSLAFDHAAIIESAVTRLRGKSSYSALPAFLLPPLFTLSELHATYQQVLGTRLDPASFRRKIIDQGIVEAADTRRVGAHRPAELYRLWAGKASPFQNRI